MSNMNPGDVHRDRPMEKLREQILDHCSKNTLSTGFARLRRMENLNCDELADRLTKMAEASAWGTGAETEYTAEAFATYVERTGLIPEDCKAVTWAQLADGELDLRTLAEALTLEDVEILRTGTWNGDVYTVTDLNDMVAAFGNVGFEPPVKLGHSEDQKILQEDGLPAAGWVTKLEVVGDTLLATLRDVPRKVAELIQRGAYKQRSAEVFFNYRGAGDGRTHPRVLRALSLLGADIPAVKGLSPLDSYLSLYGEEESDLHVAGVELHKHSENDGGTDPMPEKGKETPPAVTPEDLKKLTDQLAEMKVGVDSLKEENTRLRSELTVEQTSRLSDEVVGYVDRMKRAGKLAPAEEPLVRLILESADRTTTRKYTDGDKEVEMTAYDAVKKFIDGRKGAFEVSSTDRGTSEEERNREGSTTVTKYADSERTFTFDETAAMKAQKKALADGKTNQEAYQAYKEAGLAKARKAGA